MGTLIRGGKHCGIETLLSNLQNIEKAVKKYGKSYKQKISTCEEGHNIYLSGLWKSLHCDVFYTGIYGPSRREKAINKALLFTHRNVKYLLEKELSDSEVGIYMDRFCPYFKKTLYPQRNLFFDVFCPILSEREKREFQLVFENFMFKNKEVKNRQWLIELEKICAEKVPREVLNALFFGKTLNQNEELELKKWIEEINRCSNTLTFRVFSKAMRSLFPSLKNKEFQPLFWQLYKRGLKIVGEPDCKAERKQREWKEKQCIESKSKDKKISLSLSKVKLDCVFQTLRDFVDKIVYFYPNDFVHYFEEQEFLEEWVEAREKKSLPPLPFERVKVFSDLSGEGFKVMERFSFSLDTIDCSESEEWTIREILAFDGIIALFSDMITYTYTPVGFTGAHFGFVDGELKTNKTFPKGRLNIGYMVDELRKWTRSSKKLYTEIIRELSLDESVENRFFIQVLQDLIDGKDCSPKETKEYRGPFDSEFRRSLDWIYPAAETFKEEAATFLQSIYEKLGKQEKGLKKRIGESLMQIYNEEYSFGWIDPDWEKLIIKRI